MTTTRKNPTGISLVCGRHIRVVMAAVVGCVLLTTGSTCINLPNLPPMADAGTDKTVDVGSRATLSGADSFDPDGDPLSYHWEQTAGPTVTLEGSNTMVATFMVNEAGTYVFSLKVDDDRGGWDDDTVQIEAVTSDIPCIPPIAEAGADRQVREAHEVQLDGRASYDLDGNNDIVIYEWQQLAGPEVTLYDANTTIAIFTAPFVEQATDLVFELYVEDSCSLWSTDAVVITVLPYDGDGEPPPDQYNLAVVVEGAGSVDPDDGAYDAGTIVTLAATPADGWQFDHWDWDLTGSDNPASLVMDENKFVVAVFTHIQYTLTLSVEGGGSTDPAVGQHTYYAGDVVTITATADQGCEEWSFSNWTGDASGSTNPLVVTMDGHKDITAVFVAGNHAPVADDQWVTTELNTPVNITLTGSDPDWDEIEFFITGSPEFGHLQVTELPLVTYTPNNDFTGIDSFQFQVTDGCFDSNEATITITVGEGPPPPECASDEDCDDGNLCTTDACVDSVCVFTDVECEEGFECDPMTGECVPVVQCATDADCDDGLFCNGQEVCVDGQCQASDAPCALDETCDEASDVCIPGGGETDTIHSAETVVGAIDSEADTDAYTFTAEAGNTVIIQMSTESGWLNPEIDLYAPSGGPAEASTWGSSNALLEGHLLAESGQYTIVALDFGGNNTGEYSLSLLVIPGPTTSSQDQDGGATLSGETKSGTISLKADTDAYTFTAEVGNTVIIQMSTESGWLNPEIDLYAPSGGPAEASTWGSSNALLEGHLLAESGQYTIVALDFGGNNTGEYSLSLTLIP